MEKPDSRTEGGTNETTQRSERLFGNQPGGGDGIAKILREARENKGEEIARVANRLRIRAAYLQAIEDGRYRELPGDAYAIGFVRAYATYLGLDGLEIVRRFKMEASVSGKTASLIFPIQAHEGRVPKGAMLLLSVLLALVVYGTWYALSYRGPALEPSSLVEEAPPVASAPEALNTAVGDTAVEDTAVEDMAVGSVAGADTAVQAVAVEAAVEVSPLSVPTPTPSQPEVVSVAPPPVIATPLPEETQVSVEEAAARMIVLRAVRDTWIEIRDAGGRSIMTGVLAASQIYRPPLQGGLTLAVGDAHGVEIRVGGKLIPPLGASGIILRKVLLDPARLKAGTAVLN